MQTSSLSSTTATGQSRVLKESTQRNKTLKTECVSVRLPIRISQSHCMTLFVRRERAGRHERPLAQVTRVGFLLQMNVFMYREGGEHGEGLPADVALEWLLILVHQLMNPQMAVMYKLSFTDAALIGSLFEMSPLMSPQTLHPGETFVADIAPVRFFPRVDILVTPEVP